MTDNITQQAPQTRAPMTTEEIIDRLKQVSFTYSRLTAGAFSSKEVAHGKRAMTAAIQAVELLEQIKAELRGDCVACKSRDVQGTQEPCASCSAKSEYWEFRWPLGEEADHGE